METPALVTVLPSPSVGKGAGADGGPPVVRVQQFTKKYGSRLADDQVSLTVPAGTVYGLIGPDGAGKSSLMKAIAGVLEFDGGTVEVFGISLSSERDAEKIKSRIAFMPQGLGLNLYPELSVEENVDFFARLREVPQRDLDERKRRLLEMTRLAPFRERLMKNLSGGMKQKLGLICSLIHRPELVILDEPTTGVDPVSRRDFWKILAEFMRESPMTALVSTAYLDEASRFHRLLLMHEGRVLAEGSPADLRALGHGEDLEQTFIALCTGTPSKGRHSERSEESRLSDTARQGAGILRFAQNDVRAQNDVVARPAEGILRLAQNDGAARPVAEPRSQKDAAAHHADIEAEELTRDFDDFRAVDRVSFQVRHGEIFGLLGANGAGKTTVIKMLTGLLAPTSGRGAVAGKDMLRAAGAIKRRIGYVSQAFSLYQDLTAGENIGLYCGIYGLNARETRERANWIVEMAGLRVNEKTLSGRLPLGLRQRLALGCALVHRPQVLFLDEPTSGVDPLGRRNLWTLIRQLAHQEGVAVLITTHYMTEAENCDRLGLMHAGRLIADATPEDLKRTFEETEGRSLEIVCSEPERAAPLLAESGFEDAALFADRVHLVSHAPDRDQERIRALLSERGLVVKSIEPRTVTLEDVFVHRITDLERQQSQERAEAGAEGRAA